jgi:NitT/TauT family transport system ATP-binding protein
MRRQGEESLGRWSEVHEPSARLHSVAGATTEPGEDVENQTEPAERLIEVDEVSIGYASSATPVLSHVSLSATAGELICLVGPSGCGKSTLLKAIAGFTRVGSGSIRVRGVEVTGPGSDRGMVFQEFVLFPWLTVEQNVLFGDKASVGSPSERRERASHYLDLVGLTQYRDYHPSQLSGGMRQRVALARAWANQPTVLLMDEPFGALDARTRQELQDTLLNIFERERTLCFFVTHDTSEAVYLADRIMLMHAKGASREEFAIPIPRPRDRHSEIVLEHVKIVDQLAWRQK